MLGSRQDVVLSESQVLTHKFKMYIVIVFLSLVETESQNKSGKQVYRWSVSCNKCTWLLYSMHKNTTDIEVINGLFEIYMLLASSDLQYIASKVDIIKYIPILSF